MAWKHLAHFAVQSNHRVYSLMSKERDRVIYLCMFVGLVVIWGTSKTQARAQPFCVLLQKTDDPITSLVISPGPDET